MDQPTHAQGTQEDPASRSHPYRPIILTATKELIAKLEIEVEHLTGSAAHADREREAAVAAMEAERGEAYGRGYASVRAG